MEQDTIIVQKYTWCMLIEGRMPTAFSHVKPQHYSTQDHQPQPPPKEVLKHYVNIILLRDKIHDSHDTTRNMLVRLF